MTQCDVGCCVTTSIFGGDGTPYYAGSRVIGRFKLGLLCSEARTRLSKRQSMSYQTALSFSGTIVLYWFPENRRSGIGDRGSSKLNKLKLFFFL